MRVLIQAIVGAGLIPSLFAQSAGTALVRHAPTLNGTVEGSIQQLTAENTTLNGNARVNGDLLVPGTPTIRLNGNPAYAGTLDADGSTAPTGHTITLNGGATLRHVIRRSEPQGLPTVAAPPQPNGTRNVSLDNPSQSPGDFATLKDLTLNSNVGPIAIPPGTYGDFTANGSSHYTLGVAGSTQTTVYHFQRLTFNGSSRLDIVGPVIVTLANGVSVNGSLGNSAHPAWLILNFANGGLTLNANVSVYGYVVAPDGTITINGRAQLVGGLVADQLIINGNGLLHLLASPTANQPPAVTLTAPAHGTSFTGSATLTLAATAADVDGTVTKVEFYQGTTKLGEDITAPFTWQHTVSSPGSHTYVARATDNLGGTADSLSVTITVTSPNQPPSVTLTTPADGTLLTAPASVALAATASDPDGSIGKVAFYQDTLKLWEDYAEPYVFSATNLAAGTYTFSARAYDLQGLPATSASVTVTVVQPNEAPLVSITAPADGATLIAPATFVLTATASDRDGVVTKIEFFEEASKIAEDSSAPYEFVVSGLGAGNYSYLARATDNTGSATDSAPITVNVSSPNLPPSVALTTPANGANFTAPANVMLAATVADSDGAIAKVEFYQGSTKLGESLVAPYEFNWPSVARGSYSLTARATDNAGATATSEARAITVASSLATLPFVAEFEPSEGYQPGPLAGRQGWTATGGVAVVASTGPSSLQELSIPAGQPVAQFAHEISAPGASPVFVDFFARPVAGATANYSVIFSTTAARIALIGAASPASVQVFDGSTWLPIRQTVSIDATGRTVAWLRLTTREDYLTKKWDLYVDGRMVEADLPFTDLAVTAFANFDATGHATVTSSFDDFYAGLENPIAGDSDHDGMDDAWEVAHSLNPNLNDRAGDSDNDDISNIREYVLGTNPATADSDGDGIPDKDEVQAGLNPVVNDAAGDSDQDGVGNLVEFIQGRSLTKGAVPDTGGVLNLRVYSPARQ